MKHSRHMNMNAHPWRRRLRAAVAACLVVLHGATFAAIGQPPPDGTVIESVEVRGLARMQPSEVSGVMSLRAGEGFMSDALQADQKAIAGLGTIDPLSISIACEMLPDGRVKLIVTARENPVLSRIILVGNVRYTEKAILARLDVKPGAILPTDARAGTMKAIRDFYAGGGYKSTRVDVSIEPTGEKPGEVTLTAVIDEGEKIRIRDLIIRGNRSLSAFWLRLQLSNQGSWFIFDNYYDEQSFVTDLRTVEAMYRNRGFLDATARRGEFIYDESKAEVSPVIEIEEGPRYAVAKVEVTGSTLFTREEVEAPFRSLIGRKYQGDRFGEAIDALTGLYGRQGYVDTEVNGRFEKESSGDSVVLVVEVSEAPAVNVGEVRVSKARYDFKVDLNFLQEILSTFSAPTKDETILRENRLRPGERYRSTDEHRTAERLRKLRIFDKVNVRREPTTNPAVQDAVIEVEESPSAGYFVISAGVAQSSGPAVGLSYTNPNLFGDADVFDASVTVGPRTRRANVRYFDRYIGDTRTSYDLNLYAERDRYRAYAQQTYGMTNEWGRPWTEYRDVFARLRLEHNSFGDVRGNPREDFDSYVTAAARVRVLEDRTDSRTFPTRGYAFGAGLESGVADGFLLKLTHSYDRYFGLSEDWVYAYGHTVGLMPYDATSIGLGERFFIGGSGDLRGFAPREVGPRDPREKDLAIGGATKVTQRHELRYAITRRFHGRLFADLGILDERAFSLSRPRVGVGPGFSADMGPVVLDIDFGFAVVKGKHDRPRLLSFRVASDF